MGVINFIRVSGCTSDINLNADYKLKFKIVFTKVQSTCLKQIEFSLSYTLQLKLFCRETKINDAYTETIENFPDAFLALCTGQQLSERRATSGYLSPLSHDECQNLKIVQASLDFLTSHQKHERSNCLLVEQVIIQLMTTD